jgi:predicted MFS family arabinose efflux permease
MTVLFTVADVLGAVAPDFAVMLVARVLLGAGIGGFWAIGGTVGGRLVGPAGAPRATAIIFGGISVATVVGVPAAVALGVGLGWRAAFAATALLALVALVLLLVLLPPLGVDEPVRLHALTGLLRSRGARAGLLTTVLLVTGHFLGYTFISPFLLHQAGLSSAGLTLALFVFGATGLAGNFLVAPLAGQHLRATVVSAALAVSLAAAFLVATGGDALPWAALGLWGLGYGAVPVALQTWIGRAAPDAFEAGSSLYIASFQGSIAIGSLLGALTVATGATSTALGIGAGLAAASVVVFLATTRTGPTRTGPTRAPASRTAAPRTAVRSPLTTVTEDRPCP